MAFAALMRRLALGALALSSARCAAPMARPPSYVAAPRVLSQGGLLQVLDATGPMSYQTPTPSDMPGYRFIKRVRGEVCQNDLHLPLKLEGSHANAALSGAQTLDILWGNAAVAQGVGDALQGAPAGAVLYDLTLDLHKTSVFWLFFRRQCLVVSGALALPWAAPAKPPALVGPPLPGATRPVQAPAATPPLVPIVPEGQGDNRRAKAPHRGKAHKRRHNKGKGTGSSHSGKRHGHPSPSHRHTSQD